MSDLGYCRMCAEIKTCPNLIMINKNELNNDDLNTINLSVKISQCFQIQILSDDNLPKTICLDCCTQTNNTYKFYQKVQKAQEFLRNIVFNTTINNDNISNDCEEYSFIQSDTASNEINNENKNNIDLVPKVEITEATSTDDNVKQNHDNNSAKVTGKSQTTCVWICNKCQVEFKARSELIKHSKDVHDKSPEYKCPKCSKIFSIYKNFTRHLQLHKNNKDKFRCYTCGKQFKINISLRKHLNLRHKPDPLLKKNCSICGKVFKWPELLEYHIKHYHRQSNSVRNDIEKKFECDICKKILTNKTSLISHKKTHDAWKSFTWICNKCQMNFKTRNELIKHYEYDHGEQPEYKCPECSKSLTKYRSFTRHLQLHKNQDKFRCNICGKTFNMNSTLKRHLEVHPEVNPQFQEMCTICGKTFKNARSLEKHAKYYHVDDKVQYECDICNRKLASKSGLNTHKKTHDESTKSHICDQCGVGFRLKDTLLYHIQVIHTEINKDNYIPCSLCPARFKHKIPLRRHIRSVHSAKRFECEMCGKKYYHLTSYTEHMRLHTGERPFECRYCKKRFRLKRQLENHIRQHTGEKPYSCTDCHHDFTNLSNYIKHMRRKHGVTSFKNVQKDTS